MFRCVIGATTDLIWPEFFWRTYTVGLVSGYIWLFPARIYIGIVAFHISGDYNNYILLKIFYDNKPGSPSLRFRRSRYDDDLVISKRWIYNTCFSISWHTGQLELGYKWLECSLGTKRDTNKCWRFNGEYKHRQFGDITRCLWCLGGDGQDM